MSDIDPGPIVAAGRPSQALKLFATSTRNLLPRLLNAGVIAAVSGWYVGATWAVLWFAAVSICLIWGIGLRNRIEKAEAGVDLRRVRRWVDFSAFVSSALQVTMSVALWSTGQGIAMMFAVMSTFIGATYILLQYYADLRTFRLLLSPYVVALVWMAGDIARRAEPLPAVMTFVGGVAVVVNFFYLSRRSLDRSRTTLRDARERARRGEEAAGAANAAKSAFLATMSHEIRTPLNGVLGMTQAMAADKLSPVQRDRLSVIHRSGESLLAILNDLLDLSKIEAGKLELEDVEFDLGEVARGAYSAFTALANKKGLSFALDIEQARGRYQGDPTRLRQILYNLISNALKFTEQGEIRVTASYDGALLTLSVADTGLGISKANMSRLFGKFDQLDSSTTRRFGGTGLGLSICLQLAELMGGDIGVESELGEGSRFTVHLPLARTGEEKVSNQVAPPPLPEERGPVGLRVLAAEDNAVNQLVLKTLLHQLGIEPTVVDNGFAAIEAWEGGDWDVILMDIQMPGMDGLTATNEIRGRELSSLRPRTPIVALTANAMSHQVEQYVAAGMDGHVAKPIEAAALFEAICAVTAPQLAEDDSAAAAVA